MMKKILIIAWLIFSSISMSGIKTAEAQELPYTQNLSWEHERHSWSASWVSPGSSSVTDYGVFLYRNAFDLENVPETLKIYISADNRYRLYVNGHYIAAGPARGSFMYWRYETFDIAEYLISGRNVIAVEVINFGIHRPVAQFSRQTALIFQSEVYGEMLNTGTGKWKVIKDDAYHVRPVTPDMTLGKYYVAGPCDSIVAEVHPWEWRKREFNDNSWEHPVIIQKGVGRGYMHGTPWMLVPREIPLLEEKIERIPKVVRTMGAQMNVVPFTGENRLEVPASTRIRILLDQTWLTIGYPVIRFSKGKGSKVKIIYSEALYDVEGNKGNRNDTEGKEIIGYSDIILPDGGDDREIKTTWLRTYRYVQLEIETAREPLIVHDFYGIFAAYPFRENGTFTSDDPVLGKIWDAGWRTARLCAGETYMDCPYWEQLQYLGDTRIQALISLYVSGDDRLMRNAIMLADHSRIPEGLTLSRGPSYIHQIIPAFSLYWIAMVHDYYLYREDDAFIRSFLPGIQAVLGWFERRMDSNGLIGPLEWLNFADWTDGFKVGAPAGVDDGNSALVSLNLVYALERAAELYQHFDMQRQADLYRSEANRIRSSVYEHCWSDSLQLLADTPEMTEFSQHTNIFGILTDCIPIDNQTNVMQQVLENPDLIQTTIYYKFYLFEAMLKTGMSNQYLSMLQPWKEMLAEGLTTFKEDDYADRSDCHAWSSSPLYHFLSLVAGIRPDAPGFKTVRIEPAFGHLEKISVQVPHPAGIIGMNLSRKKKKLEGSVELPAGMQGILIWEGEKVILSAGQQEIRF